MNTKKYFNRVLLVILFAFSLSSCNEAGIELTGVIDEGIYNAATRVDAMLLDAETNKGSNVIAFQGDKVDTYAKVRLSQKPRKAVDFQIKFDAGYLEAYNEEHGTSFELYPSENVTVERGGVFALAPDETTLRFKVTITRSDELEEDVTYLIPLVAAIETDGITGSSEDLHLVYMVDDIIDHSNDTYKGPNAVKNIVFFEVNDVNPLNALEFVLAEGADNSEYAGALFFDYVVLFSANINYNREEGRVYVHNNPNVQFLLDNNEQYLQPLRKRGMKVFLGLLGNRDESGLAQLSELGARMFAEDAAAICNAYNLDGVTLDDEYSNDPDLTNPLFTNVGAQAGAQLIYELKRAMPDKEVMVYYLGQLNAGGLNNTKPIDGYEIGQLVDCSVANYGSTAATLKGGSRSKCSGMSIELNLSNGDSSTVSARRYRDEGYGHYMFFAPNPAGYYVSKNDYTQYQRCQDVCVGLYDTDLAPLTHYYKKNDTKRIPLEE